MTYMDTQFEKGKAPLKSNQRDLSPLGTRHLATAGDEATSTIDIFVDFDAK